MSHSSSPTRTKKSPSASSTDLGISNVIVPSSIPLIFTMSDVAPTSRVPLVTVPPVIAYGIQCTPPRVDLAAISDALQDGTPPITAPVSSIVTLSEMFSPPYCALIVYVPSFFHRLLAVFRVALNLPSLPTIT